MNKNCVLGIDLGTSSVKVLKRYADGSIVKTKATYEEISPEGWWKAIEEALSQMDLQDVAAVGLSSQVGTYIVDEKHVISWNTGAGAEELAETLKTYEKDVFVREISMPHPEIVSYPIPRLRYVKKHFPDVKKVGQPKDFICEKLTGNWVTDPYSWRGLANLERKEYSSFFLQELGYEETELPKMLDCTSLAGYTKVIFPEPIPVYVGLNDYYAGLLGMGIGQVGDMFDVSGTSEHLGIIEEEIQIDTKMVSGPYLQHNVHYGVTASSGASILHTRKIYGNQWLTLEEAVTKNPPIFLPYLNGERAPIWNPDARGVLFGIEAGCSREAMAYATLEGVIFSLYHICETMGKPAVTKMKTAGGAAEIAIINELKAELFGIPVAVLAETDTSAVGAAMVAEKGLGLPSKSCEIKEEIVPTGRYREWLLKRYEIYKALYPAVKDQFDKLKEMKA